MISQLISCPLIFINPGNVPIVSKPNFLYSPRIVASHLQREDLKPIDIFGKTDDFFHQTRADMFSPHFFSYRDAQFTPVRETGLYLAGEGSTAHDLAAFYRKKIQLPVGMNSFSASTLKGTPSGPNVRLSDSPPISLQYSRIFSASDGSAFLISTISSSIPPRQNLLGRAYAFRTIFLCHLKPSSAKQANFIKYHKPLRERGQPPFQENPPRVQAFRNSQFLKRFMGKELQPGQTAPFSAGCGMGKFRTGLRGDVEHPRKRKT